MPNETVRFLRGFTTAESDQAQVYLRDTQCILRLDPNTKIAPEELDDLLAPDRIYDWNAFDRSGRAANQLMTESGCRAQNTRA
jgi:hypothetical protein